MFLTGKWAFLPVKGCSMNKVNLWFFYMLGFELHVFTTSNYRQYSEDYLWPKTQEIDKLVNNLVTQYPSAQSSRDVGKRLLAAIRKFEEYGAEGYKRRDGLPSLPRFETGADSWSKEAAPLIESIAAEAKKLETALEAEIPYMHVYYPGQKLIYSTSYLVEQADLSLPESTQHKIDDMTTTDMREGGRCLAFDLPTAAGFHILRAIERTLAQYALICSPGYAFKDHVWGEYTCALDKVKDLNIEQGIKDDAKKVHALLDLIRKERNSLMHPKETLSIGDALALFNIAQSAITIMAERLPEIQNAK